ncbi:MAG: excinuclease ABC subunit UvrC [Proteobacteria bacterium]|nr:excinuclease ABC subunit UvrC [Pseudomonadota bacterium]
MNERPPATAAPEAEAVPEAAAARDPAAAGSAVVTAALGALPRCPGVYRMVGAKGEVLYVGKARNLKKRVASYANVAKLPLRLRRMVAQTAAVEVVTTHTEVEALLLEANLIKRLRPRCNILLRDDKSFPYILLRRDHAWAQLIKYRGARNRAGEYFGPFASVGAVNQTLNALQRAFPLRSCSDSIFACRTRPCLQYQIKRCTAPCVGRIGPEDYQVLVDEARAFLAGKSRQVQKRLAARMQEASEALEFESAAVYRDRIRALTQIQASQDINVASVGEADVVAAHQEGGQTCVEVFFFRSGQNYGNRAYFPAHAGGADAAEVLSAFLGQFYQNKHVPRRVLLSHPLPEQALIEEALSVRAGRRVRIARPLRGARRKLVEHARENARLALARKLSESAAQNRLLEQLAKRLRLEAPPRRIEVYDNSHISGTSAVGSMIVAGPEGYIKSAYRKFTIKNLGAGGITPGDDYGMMREVLTRRFTRLVKEDPDLEPGTRPDLIIVDGGAGQLRTAIEVFADLGVRDVATAAIAKGPDRGAGRERLHLPGRPPLSLDSHDPVLYFLQRLRDEAHRFAIGAHRSKRAKAAARSALDDVPGVGGKRKRALLHHFGSARGVAEAGIADLEKVAGISRALARTIYDYFHAEG